MSTATRLTEAQREQIGRWLADGYTDTQIVRAVARLARDGACDDDGHPWPSLTRQAVAYWRRRFAQKPPPPQPAIASGAVIADREAVLRRYRRRIGELEDQLDAIAAELRRLEDAGALSGRASAVPTVRALPVEGEDGVRVIVPLATADGPAPAAPEDDPLLRRYLVLAQAHERLTAVWQRLLADLARYARVAPARADEGESASERLARLLATADAAS